jgi:hypothetical protein
VIITTSTTWSAQEKIRSIFALPMIVNGTVRGVLYGATRATQPIGDVALHHATHVASATATDFATLLNSAASQHTSGTHAHHRSRRALNELAALARTVNDPALREQLARIHHDLGGSAIARPTRQSPHPA